MLAEMICAVAVLMTVRLVRTHVQELVEQHTALAAQVLFLSVKVRELRALTNKLKVQNEYFRYEAAAAQRCVAVLRNERRRDVAARMTASSVLC